MGANLLIFVLCFYFFLLFFCNKRLGLYSLSYGPLLYLAVSRELIASVVTVFNPFSQKQSRNIWSPCFCKSYWQASVIVKFVKRLFTRIDYKYCIFFSSQKNGLFILTSNQLLCHFLLAGWLQLLGMKVILNLKFSCCCLLLLSCPQLCSWYFHVFLPFTLAANLRRGHGGLHSLLLELRRRSSSSALHLSPQNWKMTWCIRTLILCSQSSIHFLCLCIY